MSARGNGRPEDGRVPDGTGLSQAEPASRLGPPGFDPSRLPNGPDLWRLILSQMPEGAIVAGGAVRDFLLGYEPKDIDVFMGLPPVAESASHAEAEAFLDEALLYDPRHGLMRIENTHERFEEYAAVSNIVCVSSGTLFGHRVDAIDLDDFEGGAKLVGQFDFGLTRCWFDGERIHDTPEAALDRARQCMTLLLGERVERSLARFERLRARWGGAWRLDRRDSDGSPEGGDACGSVEDDSAGRKASPNLSSEPPSNTRTGEMGDE